MNASQRAEKISANIWITVAPGTIVINMIAENDVTIAVEILMSVVPL